MDIFLHILMYIGLALLGILAFILLVVLLVLFFPVFYNAKGSYKDDDEPFIRARVHWLFGFFHLSFDYGSEDPLKIKILWFRLNKKKKTTEDISFDEPDSDEDSSLKGAETGDAEATTNSVLGEDVKTSNFETIVEKPTLVNEDTAEATEEETKPSKDETDSKEARTSNIKKKKASSQKTNIYDKIKAYIGILKSERFKAAFRYSKDKIRKILKNILPRKWDITCLIGFDDPSTTGNLIAITSMLYPVIAKHIHVYGSFDKKVIDVKGYAKGHVTVITLLINGLKIYFNKDIKKIIKLFKEV